MFLKIALLILIYYVAKHFFKGIAMYQRIKANYDQMQNQATGSGHSQQTRSGAQANNQNQDNQNQNDDAINAEFRIIDRED